MTVTLWRCLDARSAMVYGFSDDYGALDSIEVCVRGMVFDYDGLKQ